MKSKVPRGFLLSAFLLLLSASITWGRGPGTVTAVDYTLTNGAKLTGYLSLPPDYQEGARCPAILLIHGG
ncbi:MAG: hypothetical protein AB1424_18870 [Thermodesulfobacteriota bacterium]